MVSVSIFSGPTIPEIAQVTDGCGVFPAMFTSFLEKKTKIRLPVSSLRRRFLKKLLRSDLAKKNCLRI